jgi:hypothetical protein
MDKIQHFTCRSGHERLATSNRLAPLCRPIMRPSHPKAPRSGVCRYCLYTRIPFTHIRRCNDPARQRNLNTPVRRLRSLTPKEEP